jgi:hypothetical protein
MEAQKYEVHPAATLFPMMTDDEFEGLKQDILENGQREHVVFWCGALLDGRNRMRACEELGVKPVVFELPEDKDPWKYVISHNLHRRHLTTSQRAMVASKLADMQHGGDRKSEEIKVQKGTLIEETTEIKVPKGTLIEDAAKTLSVSPRTVKRARQVQEHGSEELKVAVLQGDVPVTLAAKLVKDVPDKREQSVLVSKGVDAVRKATAEVQAARVPGVEPDRSDLFEGYMDPNDILGYLRKLMPKIPDKTILAEMLFGITDEYEKFRIPELWEEWNRKRVRA